MKANTPAASAATSEQLAFPAVYTPIGICIAAVSALLLALIGYALVRLRLPVILYGLLTILAGCCFVLIKTALEDMSAVTITWNSQELIVQRMIGSSSYPWSHIDSIKAFDPGATFGDKGRHEEEGGRAAIGLMMRQTSRVDPKKAKEQQPKEVPPVLLVSRVGDDATKIPKAVQRLAVAKSSAGGGSKEIRRIGAMPTAPAAQAGKPAKKGFRRTQNAA